MIYPAAYARGGPAGAREVLNFAERSGCGMEPLRHTSGARFGAFEVWFDSGELHRAGLKIRVQQQPLKLLQILLEHRGEVVSREYLRNQLWANEGFGDFDQAVNIAIGKLRSIGGPFKQRKGEQHSGVPMAQPRDACRSAAPHDRVSR